MKKYQYTLDVLLYQYKFVVEKLRECDLLDIQDKDSIVQQVKARFAMERNDLAASIELLQKAQSKP